jgi:hypothetical protein
MTHINTFALIPRHSSRRPAILGLLALISGIAMATTAMAAEECGTTTCAAGFVCVTGVSTCDVSGGVMADPATGEAGAASGGSATGGETEKVAACEPSTYAYCEPAPCTKDADCGGAGMVCAEYTTSSSSGVSTSPTCDPDSADCATTPIADEPIRVEETVKLCEYKWNLPCTAAADCGEGFTCEALETDCSCGSAGAGGATGVGAPGEGATTSTGGSIAGTGAATSTGGSIAGTGAATSTGGAIAGTGAATSSGKGGATSGSAGAIGAGATTSRGGASSGGAASSDGSEDAPVVVDVAPPACTCASTGVLQCVPVEVKCDSASDCPANWTCAEIANMECEVNADGTQDCPITKSSGYCVPPNYRGGQGGVALDGSAGGSGTETTTGGDNKGEVQSPAAADPGNGDEEDDTADADADDADGADDPAEASGGCSVAAPVSGRGALSLVMLGFAAALGLGRRRSTR